ncbi:MAG: hypothetical protein EZS28_010266 [Streblomastix strix]|uniref:Uncharacterized protein n=1 Tax=Streblomastix strix TaxID=222440 RepID=A0A5J4WIM9_9EUKA|nr:MAG: hypothetical protein EZS28_010266 [Streblomastix strix]
MQELKFTQYQLVLMILVFQLFQLFTHKHRSKLGYNSQLTFRVTPPFAITHIEGPQFNMDRRTGDRSVVNGYVGILRRGTGYTLNIESTAPSLNQSRNFHLDFMASQHQRMVNRIKAQRRAQREQLRQGRIKNPYLDGSNKRKFLIDEDSSTDSLSDSEEEWVWEEIFGKKIDAEDDEEDEYEEYEQEQEGLDNEKEEEEEVENQQHSQFQMQDDGDSIIPDNDSDDEIPLTVTKGRFPIQNKDKNELFPGVYQNSALYQQLVKARDEFDEELELMVNPKKRDKKFDEIIVKEAMRKEQILYPTVCIVQITINYIDSCRTNRRRACVCNFILPVQRTVDSAIQRISPISAVVGIAKDLLGTLTVPRIIRGILELEPEEDRKVRQQLHKEAQQRARKNQSKQQKQKQKKQKRNKNKNSSDKTKHSQLRQRNHLGTLSNGYGGIILQRSYNKGRINNLFGGDINDGERKRLSIIWKWLYGYERYHKDKSWFSGILLNNDTSGDQKRIINKEQWKYDEQEKSGIAFIDDDEDDDEEEEDDDEDEEDDITNDEEDFDIFIYKNPHYINSLQTANNIALRTGSEQKMMNQIEMGIMNGQISNGDNEDPDDVTCINSLTLHRRDDELLILPGSSLIIREKNIERFRRLRSIFQRRYYQTYKTYNTPFSAYPSQQILNDRKRIARYAIDQEIYQLLQSAYAEFLPIQKRESSVIASMALTVVQRKTGTFMPFAASNPFTYNTVSNIQKQSQSDLNSRQLQAPVAFPYLSTSQSNISSSVQLLPPITEALGRQPMRYLGKFLPSEPLSLLPAVRRVGSLFSALRALPHILYSLRQGATLLGPGGMGSDEFAYRIRIFLTCDEETAEKMLLPRVYSVGDEEITTLPTSYALQRHRMLQVLVQQTAERKEQQRRRRLKYKKEERERIIRLKEEKLRKKEQKQLKRQEQLLQQKPIKQTGKQNKLEDLTNQATEQQQITQTMNNDIIKRKTRDVIIYDPAPFIYAPHPIPWDYGDMSDAIQQQQQQITQQQIQILSQQYYQEKQKGKEIIKEEKDSSQQSKTKVTLQASQTLLKPSAFPIRVRTSIVERFACLDAFEWGMDGIIDQGIEIFLWYGGAARRAEWRVNIIDASERYLHTRLQKCIFVDNLQRIQEQRVKQQQPKPTTKPKPKLNAFQTIMSRMGNFLQAVATLPTQAIIGKPQEPQQKQQDKPRHDTVDKCGSLEEYLEWLQIYFRKQ